MATATTIYPPITKEVFGPPDDKSEEAITGIIDHIWEDKGNIKAIGAASYHPDVSIRRVLNEEYESIQNLTDFECNWLVQLYASTNRSHAKEVTQTVMLVTVA